MIDLSPGLADALGGALGFGFSVAILSYLIGDNPLYRLALHVFIGAAVGYTALIVVHQVLIPRLVEPLTSGRTDVMLFALGPLILFLFLALKLSPALSDYGNVGIAVMLGVGTAIAIAGALSGTLLPQIEAAQVSLTPIASANSINNAVILIGTLSTLLYFQFWVRARPKDGGERVLPMRIVAGVGRAFIALTLGATYAGMILSGIALFSERLIFLWDYISQFLG
jgi:hypothetical protein